MPLRPPQVDAPPALRMRGIRKAYPGVVALAGVDLDVRRGEIHALLGENGAGKSTLMKTLSGASRTDGGDIAIDGETVHITSPRHARALGIGMVYQELALVPGLTAAANILLGREPRRRLGLIDERALRAAARQWLERVGATFDVSRLVSSLSIPQQQLVEIARALSLDARILVMDEPTSALGEQETQALFRVMRTLAADGVAILFISHRLEEIFQVADRVTVLRDGRHVGTQDIAVSDRGALVRLMVGRDVDEGHAPVEAMRGAEVLRVESLTRRGVLHDISFSVHAGEVVGIAGAMGAGRTEIARAIFGLDRMDSGRVFVHGQLASITSPRDAIRHGIGFVTEDRKREGLVLGASVRENVALSMLRRPGRLGVVSRGGERALAERYIRELRIVTPSCDETVGNLSGGNQQKTVLAKWLAAQVDVLILDEPTRGIDIGAKGEITTLVRALSDAGVGIVLISSELPEIVSLAHRAIVIREGRICGELAGAELRAERLLSLAMGA